MKAVQPLKDRRQIQAIYGILRLQSPRDALLFRFGLNTILRISDFLDLRGHDVYKYYLEKKPSVKSYLVLKEKKTGKTKRIKINDSLKKELRDYQRELDIRPNDYLFFSFRNSYRHIDRIRAWQILRDAAREIGLDSIGTHTMRKTMAYWVYKETKNIALVQKMLNHTSKAETMRYIGIDQEDIDKAYEKFQF